ncbi:MAG: CBS domain-containing protein [Bacteroidota bacterium]
MNRNESIAKHMATQLITFKPEDDIWDAINSIVKHKISGTPIVDSSGKLVGMLSEADCMRVMLEGAYNNQPGGVGKVKDYMAVNVSTMDIDTTVMEAAYSFAHSKYKRFPVLKNGRLVGQISRSDVLKAIAKLRPKVRLTPDSWQPRVPIVSLTKSGRYTENA